MNKKEFEQFVEESGKDILRYCRMIAYSNENGNELYQDTMLKLLEKQECLDCEQNIKSYAISISILLWKNKKRKFARRFRIIPEQSMTEWEEEFNSVDCQNNTLEEEVIKQEEIRKVQDGVANLPEKYRICIHLFYLLCNNKLMVLFIPNKMLPCLFIIIYALVFTPSRS